MKTLLTFVVLAPLAACAIDAEERAPSSAPCVGQTEVAPRRIAVNGVQLNGVQLNGIQLNGVQINGVELGVSDIAVGAELSGVRSDGTRVALVVSSSERRDDITTYRVTHDGTNICAADEDGIFVAGVWDETAAWHPSTTGANATFACQSSVIAKCAFWGYAPWKVGPRLHQTCTRMARADYCGTGASSTREGTAIDVFDVDGIQHATNAPDLLFEAGWNENGATCVSRPRFETRDAQGNVLLPSCWASLPSCASLEEAKGYGAQIVNASRLQSRTRCD